MIRREFLASGAWAGTVWQASGGERRLKPRPSREIRSSPISIGFETLDRKMGNVRQFDCDFAALWRSNEAASARRYQKELGCQCTYECAMSVNTLFNPGRALRIVRNTFK